MSQIPWLAADRLQFPDPETALDDPNGLLAAGGDLREARLLTAYRNGIFPWYEEDQPILWWSPAPRAVIFPDRIHISRSLRRSLRRRDWRVTTDTEFDRVIGACAALDHARSGTWITDEMREAYSDLHQSQWAHSIEVWEQGELVGGLYGLAMNRLFFGESMFSRRDDASKIGLVILAMMLRRQCFRLIDCQVGNPHLYSMGACDIPRRRFLGILSEEFAGGIEPPARWSWHYTRDEWCNGDNEDQSV